MPVSPHVSNTPILVEGSRAPFRPLFRTIAQRVGWPRTRNVLFLGRVTVNRLSWRTRSLSSACTALCLISNAAASLVALRQNDSPVSPVPECFPIFCFGVGMFRSHETMGVFWGFVRGA